MDKIEFKKLLFKVAFCAVACDGDIDDREIEEMKEMDKHASFFDHVDLSNELSELVNEFHSKGAAVIEELFSTLREVHLNPIQELLVLEVALRIINADNRHDENEVRFLNLLRSKLELHDQTINDRFGDLDILYTSDYSRDIVTEKMHLEFSANARLPDIQDMSELLDKFKKE
jgi:hypothetical protein